MTVFFMRYLFCAVLLCLTVFRALAGDGDSMRFHVLNAQRIQTNRDGMYVLGTWGLVNTVGGIAGAVSTTDQEWQHFHQMNAAWGIVNTGIAFMGYLGTRKELAQSLSNMDALHRYEATKRLYLINAGLDVVYIATGLVLDRHGRRGDRAVYRGFGKSLMLQGAGLLLFDVNMFLAHQRKDKRWYRALKGFYVSGEGIVWRWVM
jgi:hypothetical protein